MTKDEQTSPRVRGVAPELWELQSCRREGVGDFGNFNTTPRQGGSQGVRENDEEAQRGGHSSQKALQFSPSADSSAPTEDFDKRTVHSYFQPMSSADLAARIAEEAAALPLKKQRAVLEFVLFIKQRAVGDAPKNGDAVWERIIDDPRPRPKLEAFLRETAAEGEELLDPHRL